MSHYPVPGSLSLWSKDLIKWDGTLTMPQLTKPPLSKETAYFIKQFKGHTTFACQSTEGAVNGYNFFHYNSPLETCYPILIENNKNKYNVYFTVNETSDAGRKAEHIEHIRAIFADDDDYSKTPKHFPLEPSIITRTSGDEVQGYKYQYYWLTNTKDYKTWERVLRGIIKVYGTDKNVHDLARIFRVPGFLNHKYDPPEPCKMIACSGDIYEWDEILRVFPPLPEAEVFEAQHRDADGEFNELTHLAAFKNPIQTGDVTNSINSLIIHWAHHYSAENIRQKVDQLYEDIDQEIKEEHKDRYYKARVQVDKFIKSAKEAVTKFRHTQAIEEGKNFADTNTYDEIPENLVWDWSALASNAFTSEEITPYLYDAASEAGEWNGIGAGPAVVSAMSICSALLNKNVLIHETYDQLVHFCSQGSIIVMDTGSSKSSIYEAMNAPFFEYEEQLKNEWKKVKNVNLQLVKALESDMAKNKTKYAKKGEHTDNELLEFAQMQGKLQDRIDKIPVKAPALHTNDITEETIFTKMEENNGVIALISDDARKPINILLGEYKNGITAEGIYISGFTRTSITRERMGQEERSIRRPSLNCLYFVQPDTALKLRDSDMYIPSGLAARMPMFFYPTYGADIVRNRQRRDINHTRMEPYYKHLRGLCHKRSDNPLHIRLNDAGMARCKEFDMEFADKLDGEWQGEYGATNKLISTSLQYATCLAALDDSEFQHKFQANSSSGDSYYLSLKYMNMGFAYANILFSQSIMTQNTLSDEGLPRKCLTLIKRLKGLYENGKIYEGFVIQGDFINNISVPLRPFLPQMMEFLTEKKWLFTTLHQGEKRKLNGGFPNKLIDTGDIVHHLNIKGIQKRDIMKLDKIEDRTDG